MKRHAPLCILLLFLLLVGCGKQEPIKIGFVGGLSGKGADLGVPGRNGVLLALEHCNAGGGIDGRELELVVRDDEQKPETARRVIGELIGQKLELVIGPMTSNMAMAMVPLVNASKTVLLSPTATTTDLAGKDDNFIRVISVTSRYGARSASYQYHKLGTRTVAFIYDTSNKSYSDSWIKGFRDTFEALGGRVVLLKAFASGEDTVFRPLAKEVVAARADMVLVITNAVDAAMLCQQLRSLQPAVRISLSEWSSTERFIELAGAASEGVNVAQFVNRNDASPRYRDFLKAYQARFNHPPGFAGLAGYDAALVAIEALRSRKGGQNLKEAILARRVFQGVQQPLRIDRFGDADRPTYMTRVKDGHYVTVE